MKNDYGEIDHTLKTFNSAGKTLEYMIGTNLGDQEMAEEMDRFLI